MKQDALAKATEATAIELTPKTVKAYLSPNATEQEVALFLNQCVMFGLNPFKREIYLIKYGNNPATFVVGYEVYLKRAERSDKWAGLESGTTLEDEGKSLKAWAKVYRKDWTAPLYHEVYLEEYVQTKSDGTPTRFWKEKPKTMLKKVAISQAFRMAFPDEFAGMPYTDAEMPVDHSKLPAAEVRAEVVNTIQEELEADGEVVNQSSAGQFDKLPEFQKAKKALGDRVYYDCLGQFGFEKSNQVPPEQRDAILKVMRTMYKDLHPATQEA